MDNKLEVITNKISFKKGIPVFGTRAFTQLFLPFLLSTFAFFGHVNVLQAQCITVYPYNEGFETVPAWTPGGTNSDWAWGTPNHPTINTAGGGTKSWMVGGLSGSFYNYSELSTLQSPCFNFSGLTYPWISFKIFWEDEWHYDGMVLQSSINGGVTWQNVGAYNDPVDCMNANWYHYNNITWLTSIPVKHGWTGRIGPTVASCQGGNGSGGWVTAKHCLTGLAGQANVIFRFLFGAGTTCNSYDGIAIDDILIQNAPPEVPTISYVCATGNSVNFTGASNPCPVSFTWNFGDPVSGPSNTSTTQNPSHTFSAPGTYTVSLNTTGVCNPSGATTVTLSILGATTSVTNISCNSLTNGSASVVPTGGSGPFTYLWSPTGGNAATASNLSIGNYTVTVTAANSCPTTASVNITQPTALVATNSQLNVICNGGNSGTGTVNISGGTGPYTYLWSPTGGNASTATGLSAGNYTCTSTDANGCQITQSFTITQSTALNSTTSIFPTTCGNANGAATVNVLGGQGPYSYSWAPTGGNAASANNLTAGTYTCTITDANNCTRTQIISIPNSSGVSLAVSATSNILCFGQATGSAQVLATGTNTPFTYLWSNGNTSTNATGLTAGTFIVTVTDINNCIDTVHITISQAPALNINASCSDNSVCTGQSVSLNANPSGGVPNYTIMWTPGNLIGASQTITPTTSGIYTVYITDQNSCIDSSTISVSVNPIPVSNFANDISSGCAPVCVQFSDLSTITSPGNVSSWSWEFGDGNFSTSQNPLHCYDIPGNYSVSLQIISDSGCIASYVINNLIQIFANADAQFSFSPTVPTVSDPTVNFIDQSTNASSWNWSFGDQLNSTSILQNPTFNYLDATCFPVILTVTSPDGCVDTTSHEICILPEVDFYVPNAFTPNSNGNNDVFFPVGQGLDWSSFHMMIFDRWGNLIYETKDITKGWDGRSNGGKNIAQADVYVWSIEVTDIKGNTRNLIGHVSLIR